MEKLEPLHTISGKVKYGCHYGKQHGVSSKKVKTDLHDDPALLTVPSK